MITVEFTEDEFVHLLALCEGGAQKMETGIKRMRADNTLTPLTETTATNAITVYNRLVEIALMKGMLKRPIVQ